jgi:hypothetical protein
LHGDLQEPGGTRIGPMARRLIALALAAAGAAAALYASRRASLGDPSRNGGSQARAERLRRELDQARERLRADIDRAREQS